jgi:hypothetical protein
MTTEPLSTSVPKEFTTLSFRPLFAFQIDVRKPDVVGATPGHDRRIGEITGGRFEGPKLRGKVLSGGSDWQSLRRDGATTLNVRIVLQTDDDALIAMRYHGLRHGPQHVLERLARGENVNPSEYYMRATAYYETAAERYDWLNRVVSIACGHRVMGGAIYQVFEIL